jgi:asparagine synthase (glutamine-hydrolysing)
MLQDRMNAPELLYCEGQAEFPAELAALPPLEAWQRALQQPALLAATGGRFAVALRLADGTVLAAVDRFGIESLCLRLVDGQPRFAARADTLGGDAALDLQAIYDYLYFHVIPAPRTIFAGVSRVPAAQLARIRNGQLSWQTYWQPDFRAQPGARFEPLKAEFLGLLQEAVRSSMREGQRACFLSGGTDSSTVAGMLGRVAGQGAQTYSIGFEAEGYDEMAFARIAARHFGCQHHEYYVTPADLVAGIPGVATHYDQPFGNSSALPAFYCAQRARQDGVTHLLAGDGGDELFGGNLRYAKQRVFSWYDDVPSALREGVLARLPGSALAGLPLLRKAASYVSQARVPMPDRLQSYNLLERLGLLEVLSEGLLARVDTGGPQAQQREVWAVVRADELVNRMLAFDWRYTLAEADLPKVCGTTELAGVGVGFPMLDRALVDFSTRLPADYKLRGLKLRWFFKEALRGFLPDEIITKKKQGFGLPFGVWATRDAALQALARESLLSLADRGLVRSAFVQQLLDQHLNEHPGYYGEMVWILMMLEQWLRGHRPDFKLG